jgi:hypothetical protein
LKKQVAMGRFCPASYVDGIFYVRDHSPGSSSTRHFRASSEVLSRVAGLLEARGAAFWRSPSPLDRAFDVVEKSIEHGR